MKGRKTKDARSAFRFTGRLRHAPGARRRLRRGK